MVRPFGPGQCALALGADGRPYIAGAFTSPQPGIVLLQTNGLAAPFVRDISTNAMVHELIVQPNGHLLVGGKFIRSGAVDGRTNLIRLTANGTFDPTFNAGSGPNGEVPMPCKVAPPCLTRNSAGAITQQNWPLSRQN